MKTRVGSVGYVNAAPLVVALDPERFDVVTTYPRAVAGALAAGEVDVALAPVAAVLTDGDFRIVPGWCIGADGPVASVVIAAESEPEDWRELVLDGTSRTSVVLARLLVTQGPLAAKVRNDLQITDVPPGEGPKRVGGSVAAVVIGEPARELPAHLKRWDLAELWKKWTGHPFVFAVWAGRPDLSADAIEGLREGGRIGVASIATRWEGADRDYLLGHLRYELDDSALIGLRRFAALAYKAGLVGQEDVHLFGPEPKPRFVAPEAQAALARAASGQALSVAEARTLAAEASDADLGLAAGLARGLVRPASQASYVVVYEADAQKAVQEQIEAAHRASASAVKPPAGATAQIANAWRAAGVEVIDAQTLWVLPHHVAQIPGGQASFAAELWVDGDEDAFFEGVEALKRAGSAVSSVTVRMRLPEGSLVEPRRAATSTWLRAIALLRLCLPEIHISTSVASLGLEACQVALLQGADDLGEVLIGATPKLAEGVAIFEADVAAAERELRVGGFEPVRRDLSWREVGGALTSLRKVRPVAERARRA